MTCFHFQRISRNVANICISHVSAFSKLGYLAHRWGGNKTANYSTDTYHVIFLRKFSKSLWGHFVHLFSCEASSIHQAIMISQFTFKEIEINDIKQTKMWKSWSNNLGISDKYILREMFKINSPNNISMKKKKPCKPGSSRNGSTVL